MADGLYGFNYDPDKLWDRSFNFFNNSNSLDNLYENSLLKPNNFLGSSFNLKGLSNFNSSINNKFKDLGLSDNQMKFINSPYFQGLSSDRQDNFIQSMVTANMLGDAYGLKNPLLEDKEFLDLQKKNLKAYTDRLETVNSPWYKGMDIASKGFDILTGLGQLYTGWKQLGLARDSFNFQKELTKKNYNQQVKALNDRRDSAARVGIGMQGLAGTPEGDAILAKSREENFKPW